MKPIFVSVVVPAHNSEATIRRSLESVLAQSFKDFEVLVVLNGIVDSTATIVAELAAKDARVKVLFSEPGRVPARNHALSVARGDFIALQDTDDEWMPNKLQLQLPPLVSGECDIVASQIECVDSNWNAIPKQEPRRPTDHVGIVSTLLGGWNCLANSSVVFRKSLTNRIGTYDDCFPICEDYHMWLRAVPFARFKVIDEVLMRYMVKASNPEYDHNVSRLLCSLYSTLYRHRGIVR